MQSSMMSAKTLRVGATASARVGAQQLKPVGTVCALLEGLRIHRAEIYALLLCSAWSVHRTVVGPPAPEGGQAELMTPWPLDLPESSQSCAYTACGRGPVVLVGGVLT